MEDSIYIVCSHLQEVLLKKNRDYKNSYEDTVNRYGKTVPLIRIHDKFSRLETLMLTNEQYVNDESEEDTLLDLAGYCVLELARRNKHAGKYSTSS